MHHKVKQHPAGVSAALAGALVVVARKFGVEFTADEAGILVAAVAAVVSVFHPRNV